MEYQLIPLQEELDRLKRKLRVSEEEKEALKTNLKEEEVARIAADGMIALPVSQDRDDDLSMSPRKQSPLKRTQSPLSDDKENMNIIPKKALESRRLAEELEREKMRREYAEELADFLRMECMFRCCECKTASRLGHEFALSLDSELAVGVEKVRAGMEGILTAPGSFDEKDRMEVEEAPVVDLDAAKAEEIGDAKAQATFEVQETDASVVAVTEELDRSLTVAAESPVQSRSPADQLLEEQQRSLRTTPPAPVLTTAKAPAVTATADTTVHPATPPSQTQHQSTPFRHHQHSIKTVTTTTTVPMQFTPISKPALFNLEDAENVPPTASAGGDVVAGTFDRAAALAAIEYRRGRAKSLANGPMTPRKQMLEGVNLKERRDISAPALGQKIGGVGGGSVSAVKGGGSLGRAAGRRGGI